MATGLRRTTTVKLTVNLIFSILPARCSVKCPQEI
jgi:hypothetical protein